MTRQKGRSRSGLTTNSESDGCRLLRSCERRRGRRTDGSAGREILFVRTRCVATLSSREDRLVSESDYDGWIKRIRWVGTKL